MTIHKTPKILFGLLLAILVSLSAAAVYADHDDEGSNSGPGSRMMGKKIDKMSGHMEKKLETFEHRLENAWSHNEGSNRAVIMQQDGTYRVSGVVVKAVNASAQTLTVEFFGFTRDVSVAGAKLIAGGQTVTLADFQAGDKLSGKGMFDPVTRAIKVDEVHNLTFRNRASGDIQTRIQQLLDMVRKLQEQIRNLRQ